MKHLLYVSLMVFVITSCREEKVPADVLSEKQMVALLTDLYVLDGYMSTLDYADSIRIKGKNLYATVYKKHRTDSRKFERSLEFYSRKPAGLDSLYSIVQANLDSLEAPISRREDKKRKDSAAGR